MFNQLGLLIVFLITSATVFSSTVPDVRQNVKPVLLADDRPNNISLQSAINPAGRKDLTVDDDDIIDRPLPASIEVKLGSTLYATPGTKASMMFSITNNRPILTDFDFDVYDKNNYVQSYFPPSASVAPGRTVVVELQLLAQNKQGDNPDVVSMIVKWRTPSGLMESVTKRVYFYTDKQQYDATKPTISYEYSGDCSGSLTPQTCHAKRWSVRIISQDQVSGLLGLRSDPVGLTLSSEFIVGTKEQIIGTYTASCCYSKVDIFAIDVLGNSLTTTIDIEKKSLSTGEISAIVLGCIIVLILIIVATYFIVSCLRKRRRTLIVYPRHRPTQTSTE